MSTYIAYPINADQQIIEAIEGETAETRQAGRQKIQYAKDHLSQIARINRARVKDVSIESDEIHYRLAAGSVRYYYPIKYATIEYLCRGEAIP